MFRSKRPMKTCFWSKSRMKRCFWSKRPMKRCYRTIKQQRDDWKRKKPPIQVSDRRRSKMFADACNFRIALNRHCSLMEQSVSYSHFIITITDIYQAKLQYPISLATEYTTKLFLFPSSIYMGIVLVDHNESNRHYWPLLSDSRRLIC